MNKSATLQVRKALEARMTREKRAEGRVKGGLGEAASEQRHWRVATALSATALVAVVAGALLVRK